MSSEHYDNPDLFLDPQEHRGPVYLKSDSQPGLAILSEVNSSPPVVPAEALREAKLPLTGGEVTSTPSEVLRHDLEAVPFVDEESLRGSQVETVIEASNPRKPIEVPMSYVAGTRDFANWAGRRNNAMKVRSTDRGYMPEPSLEVIKEYAALPTPPPPLKSIDMYRQPNGQVFFYGTDGAHRLAAALVKGLPTMPAFALRVHRLTYNVI